MLLMKNVTSAIATADASSPTVTSSSWSGRKWRDSTTNATPYPTAYTRTKNAACQAVPGRPSGRKKKQWTCQCSAATSSASTSARAAK